MISIYLDQRLKNHTVPHALLFAGASHSSKETVALQFARKLIECEMSTPHPDLYQYTPEGKLGLHTMETLKTLCEEVYLPPYSAKRKVFVIWEAERMAQTSANALLKTLEEPLPTSHILLVTSFSERLLPTIRSRCHTLYFREDKPIESAPMPELMDLLRVLTHLTYPALLEQVQKLSEQIEKQAQVEPEKAPMELTAHQKQAAEKQREGREALQLQRLAKACFFKILGWFRDLHVQHLQGNSQHLFHPQDADITQQWVERGIIPPLDLIEQAIQQAEKALERSSPLRHVLESLFLALKRICFA